MRAKYSFMAKQLEAAVDLRKKMEEHNRDQQRQLTAEREEKKNLQKRYQLHCATLFLTWCVFYKFIHFDPRLSLVEAELRKNSKRMPTVAEPPSSTDNLTQVRHS